MAVIDLADPANPRLSQEYHTVSVQGIHTARSFVIEDGPAAGEYAFLIQNGVGTEITRVVDDAGRQAARAPVERARSPDETNITSTHDTFIQTDPTDGKTYLYTAGGFTYGFRVYDVSNPAMPTQVGEWDPTPQCRNDWYSHTIDVTTVKGRRIVTMPAELFDFGAQTDASEECGTLQGNGDKAGPAVDRRRDRLRESEADHDVDEPGRPRRRAADVLTAQPADRRRPHLPVALPRRDLRARRLGRVRRPRRAPARDELGRARSTRRCARRSTPGRSRTAAATSGTSSPTRT